MVKQKWQTSTLRIFFVQILRTRERPITFFNVQIIDDDNFSTPQKSSLVQGTVCIPLKTQGICTNLLILLHLHSISKIHPFWCNAITGFRWVLEHVFLCFNQKKVHQGIQHPSEGNGCWGVRWLWSRMMVSTLILAACGALFFACRSFAETFFLQMDVSENSGTPKSSILIGFSIINHPFWGTPIFGNTQMLVVMSGCLRP